MKKIEIEYACFIEDKLDFEIIFKKFKSNKNIFIPLDIETYLLCKSNNLNIFDFNEYLTNEIHIKALNEAKNFTSSLEFKNKINYSLKSEITGLLRFRLHSIILIVEIIEILMKNFKIKNLIVSGQKKKIHSLHDAKICSEIIEGLYPNFARPVDSKLFFKKNDNIYDYYPSKKIFNINKKICISNGGYNFKRICKLFRNESYKIILPQFEKVFFFKKLIYLLRGIEIVNFYQTKKVQIEEEYFIKKINFIYQNKFNISSLLNNFYKKLNFHFNDLNQKIISLKIFLNTNNFNLLISNISRGLDGAILDSDIKNPTLCIPHGIISKAFNENDKLYKKNIAEAVFNGESKFFAIQSKIAEESLETHKINGKAIITGNLIFSYNKNRNDLKKKHILFATTLKGFTNLQYLGVDMFYEYWKILEDLNEISKKSGQKILVKVHPQFKNCKKNFVKFFNNLKFSNQRIDHLLNNAFVMIALSSGTIEDALNSKVPVILYDRRNRYKQMNCHKTNEQEKAVFHINNKKELEYAIDKIKNCKKFNFDSYIYESNIKNIFYNKILPLIKK
jgi:hypothetical protein